MKNGKHLKLSEISLATVRDEIQQHDEPLDIHSLEYICFQLNIRGHLAILTQPYIERIVAKDKTIESRFSKPCTAPFRKVHKGDILFLKQAAGPLLAIAHVLNVRFFGPLAPGEVEKIMDEYEEELALEKSFKESKRDSKYGTLIFLGEVTTIQPTPISKSDRRAWVVLENGYKQTAIL